MSTDANNETTTKRGMEERDSDGVLPMDRRGFLKVGAAGAAGVAFGGVALSSLTEAGGDSPTALIEHADATWKPSICQGCTSWCASQVLVDDGRAVKVRGNEHSKIHGEANCPKMHLGLQQVYDPDRIKQPMRRTNPEKGKDQDPEFEPISWEEAIEEIADHYMELRENEETHKFMLTRGRYTGLNGVFYGDMVEILGSPNNISHSSICAEAEKFGPMYSEGEWGYRQYDVTKTRYVILWGADPINSNRQMSHYSSVWGDVLDRAEVAVVEPRLSASAAKADEFLPVEPGQDGALASAMAHVILTEGLWSREFVGDFEDGENRFVEGEEVDPDTFEEEYTHGVVEWWNLELKDKTPQWAAERSSVPADQIERVAIEFAEAGPQAISWVGGGPVMQVRGAYNSMAAHALNGLVGSADSEGGTLYGAETFSGDMPSTDGYVDDVAEEGLDNQVIDQRGYKEFPNLAGGTAGSGVLTNNAADAILDEDPYEIKMLISYWNNFAFSNPECQRWEEALAKLPFHVTIETHPSEQVWFADIVLPATHHQFERWGHIGAMANARSQIAINTPVVDRVWDVKSDETEVAWLLAEELADRGFDNLLEHYRQFEDPETGEAPTNGKEFEKYATKIATQPLWDPDEHQGGDQFDGWDEFVEVGVWNSEPYEYRHRWGEMNTDTGLFEFYSETLKRALEEHAENHDTDVDDILETCKYDVSGEKAFVPHYQEPYIWGEDEYELDFVDYKSRLNREGRSANCTWYQEFTDANPGDEPGIDVAKLNPIDAERLDIENGDEIRIESPVGEIECTAKVWEGVKPGTVAKTYGQGHWAYGNVASEEFGEKPRGGNNNEIIPADYDRLSGSTAFYGITKVNVEKL